MKICYKHTHQPYRSGLLYFEGVGCTMCKAEKEYKISTMNWFQRLINKIKTKVKK